MIDDRSITSYITTFQKAKMARPGARFKLKKEAKKKFCVETMPHSFQMGAENKKNHRLQITHPNL